MLTDSIYWLLAKLLFESSVFSSVFNNSSGCYYKKLTNKVLQKSHFTMSFLKTQLIALISKTTEKHSLNEYELDGTSGLCLIFD